MSNNFTISDFGEVSKAFLERGYSDFQTASDFIKNLTYRRNSDKNNKLCVLSDNGGTCSTKHAVLKRIADENSISEINLMLGIFKMNALNTPKIAEVLSQYNLEEMPEAHNYLKWNDEYLDFTRRNASPRDFLEYLYEEIEILPEQITDYKVNYHREFIKNYLHQNPEIPYSLEEFWAIREKCITALQQ